MELFTEHTTDSRGRLRITIETDAVYVREMAQNYRDLIRWIASEDAEKLVAQLITQFTKLSDL